MSIKAESRGSLEEAFRVGATDQQSSRRWLPDGNAGRKPSYEHFAHLPTVLKCPRTFKSEGKALLDAPLVL